MRPSTVSTVSARSAGSATRKFRVSDLPPSLCNLADYGSDLPQDVHVAIVGAGVAGLACAMRLSEVFEAKGLQALVLEGDARVGGRILSERVDRFHADAGACWIHGVEGNPLIEDGILSTQDLRPCTAKNIWIKGPQPDDSSNFHPNKEETDTWRGRLRHLCSVVESSDSFGTIDIKAELHRCGKWTNADSRLLQAFELWLGAPCEGLVPGEWDPEAALGDYPGAHAVLPEGMGVVIERLLARCRKSSVRIKLGTRVDAIEENANGAQVRICGEGGVQTWLQCQYVVCTSSLGYLRTGAISFQPPLPNQLQSAIDKLRMCAYSKCVLLVSDHVADRLPVWNWTDHDLFPIAFNYKPVLGKPLIVCTSVDERVKAMDDECVVEQAMRSLGLQPHLVVSTAVTHWHKSKWACGSYSFSPAGCDCSEVPEFTASMSSRRLLFAGEHTHEEHQGSVHGAYLSGLDAANSILSRLD